MIRVILIWSCETKSQSLVPIAMPNGTPVQLEVLVSRKIDITICGHDLFSAVDKDVSGYANGMRPPQRDNVITVYKRHVMSRKTAWGIVPLPPNLSRSISEARHSR